MRKSISSLLLLSLVIPGISCRTSTPEKSEPPLVQKVKAFRAAKAAKDSTLTRSMLAPGAAQWFERKEGPGIPIKPSGEGVWSQWDRYFNARSEIESQSVDNNAVTVRIIEINDFYRLIERPATPVNVTYFFDSDERISGILVFRAEGERPKDRFDEFKAWAKKNRPEDLKELMPEGEIVPTLDRAQKWRVILNEWRQAVGLPVVE